MTQVQTQICSLTEFTEFSEKARHRPLRCKRASVPNLWPALGLALRLVNDGQWQSIRMK